LHKKPRHPSSRKRVVRAIKDTKLTKKVTKKQKKAIRVNQEQKGLTTNQISYK